MKKNDFNEIIEVDENDNIELPLTIKDPDGSVYFNRYREIDGKIEENKIRILPVTLPNSDFIETHHVTTEFDIEREFKNNQFIKPNGMIAYNFDFVFRGKEIDAEKSYLLGKNVYKYKLNKTTGEIIPVDLNPAVEELRINNIKKRANEIIVSKFPEFKQLNMYRRIIQLSGKSLSTEEQTELTILDGIFAWIDSVRFRSNQAELSGELVDNINWP